MTKPGLAAADKLEGAAMAAWLEDEAKSEWERGYRGRHRLFKRAAAMIREKWCVSGKKSQ